MCSSPKPKKRVIQKKSSTPTMNAEMMARFSKVANEADDRRQRRLDMQKAREQEAAQSMAYRNKKSNGKHTNIDNLYTRFMSFCGVKNL